MLACVANWRERRKRERERAAYKRATMEDEYRSRDDSGDSKSDIERSLYLAACSYACDSSYHGQPAGLWSEIDIRCTTENIFQGTSGRHGRRVAELLLGRWALPITNPDDVLNGRPAPSVACKMLRNQAQEQVYSIHMDIHA